MRARRPGPARRTRPLTQEELTACREAIERDNPGYMDENTKLTQLVKTLTGVRMLYGIFNICMFKMYDLSLVQPIILFFSAFFFLFWRGPFKHGGMATVPADFHADSGRGDGICRGCVLHLCPVSPLCRPYDPAEQGIVPEADAGRGSGGAEQDGRLSKPLWGRHGSGGARSGIR